MVKNRKIELVRRVNVAAGEYATVISLFRQAVGKIIGVNGTDMECLTLIFAKGLSTPSELSRYTGLTSGATTAMLDRLEAARLIERRPNPKDRRGTLIVLTNERSAELGKMFAPGREAIDRLTSSYSEGELELIAEYLGRLVAAWEDQRKNLMKRSRG